jgi:site-specific DNA-cytosine methylase
VLNENMKSRKLHRAPIIDDVRELTTQRIKDLDPFIVTGGFPCQDISMMTSSTAGIQGTRSGIIFPLLRQLKGTNVRVLFMENSAAIRTRGLDELKPACVRAGFPHLVHCNVAAMHVGAPHRRLRWFGMAYKSLEDLKALMAAGVRFDAAASAKLWNAEPCPRVLPRPAEAAGRRDYRQRYAMMGNSVVPACVRCAAHKLCAQALGLPGPVMPALRLPRLTVDYPDKQIFKQGWATPTRSPQGPCRRYTERCASTLSDQVLYERDTQYTGDINTVRLNPAWVAWLMGYPPQWSNFRPPQ